MAFVLVTGCPSGGDTAKNSVSGKVTLDGKPVAGIVTFIGADNKEVGASPTGPEGNYSIPDATPGQVKVLVKPAGNLAGGGPKLNPPPGGMTMPDMGGTAQGVSPPKKYESAATTPLTYEVKTGKQTFDIKLEP